MKKSLVAISILVLVSTIFVGCGKSEEKEADTGVTESKNPYYYNENNQNRYKAYGEKNPDMEEDEVIWRVEADLDKEQYAEMTQIKKADENDETILVNKHFNLREDYIPENLVYVQGEQQATENTAKAFKEMEKEAQKKGISLNVRSGYRSVSLQNKYYNNYASVYGVKQADMYSARPTSSEHHTGRALDIVSDDWSFDNFEKTESCKWLHENSYDYGFILRYGKDITDITGYQYESWHVTYVGKAVAKKFKSGEVKSLEEYWVKYVKYSPEDK